ncbi:DUF4145 domain-containing protein [Micromonospora sp. NPDC006766]|uniref:DUF4145 domain-containing protein n=1 Tax=Micromonospora sp. NPDC006766 TaxID=3154778 RepID=UPI0033E316B8
MSDFYGPTKHFVLCYYCQKPANATEQGSVYSNKPEIGPPSLITLVSCDNCGQALVLAQEDYGEGWDEMVRVWPSATRALSSAVPKPLRDEHNEARKCFDAKAYTAAAVMVGRTLEGVCTENGIKGRNLIGSLREMKEKNLIDDRLYQWADELRVLRNEGAHYTGSQVSREDAADALALSEAMLDYMYVLTAKFEEFRQRRAAKAAPTRPAPAQSPAAESQAEVP